MSNVKKVIGSKILVSKINSSRESKIYLPETTLQKSLSAVIRHVGSEVKNTSLQKDSFVICDTTGIKKIIRLNKAGEKLPDFLIEEKDVLLIRRGNILRPPGKRVLLQRIHNEIKVGKIIIPGCYPSADQSLFGVVAQKGILNEEVVDCNCEIGDIVKIQKWDMLIREIEIDDKYYLSVPIKMLDYKCDKSVMEENFIEKR